MSRVATLSFYSQLKRRTTDLSFSLSDAQHQLALEDIEQPSAVTYSATQSLHATLSHNHQQPVEPVERAGFSQVTPGNLDQLDRDDDAISYNIPPAKRQMRDRKPNTPSNTTGNGRTPGIRAQDSLKKSKPAKVIDTKAKIREEITNATLAQRKAFLIEKQDYFAPLLQQGNYLQKLIAQFQSIRRREGQTTSFCALSAARSPAEWHQSYFKALSACGFKLYGLLVQKWG